MKGFLALPQNIMTWFPGDPLSGLLYIYLALEANWKDSEHPLPKQRVCLKAGQLVCSLESLAARTGLTQRQLRTHLARLQFSSKIDTQNDKRGRIITINKYKEIFLDIPDERQTKRQRGDKEATNERQYQNTDTQKQEHTEDTFVGSARADPTPYGSFLELWNQNRGQLASVQKITKGRKLKIKARLTEEPSLDYWAQTVKRMAASTFCCSGGWASFDWLTTNDTNHLKVSEGKYDNKSQETNSDDFFAKLRALPDVKWGE